MSDDLKSELEDALDGTGENLGELMRSLRIRADNARRQGETSKYRVANALYNQAAIIAMSRLRIKIKQVDKSTKMTKLIKDMKSVNKSLADEAKVVKDLVEKLTAAGKAIARAEKLFNQVIKLAG